MIKESISVFFPAYNDAGTIGRMVDDAISTLESIGNDYEIIVINDGSTDKTRMVLDELSKKNDRIKVIHHLRNIGYGGALKTGFSNSSKDIIFYTDGDGQYDVKELPLLLYLMKDDVDVVNGYQIQRADSFYRIILGKIYNWIVKKAFNLKLKYVDCDFRLIRRSVFDKIKLQSDGGAVCVELVKRIQDAGFTIVETAVHHYPRRYGRSQFFAFSNLLEMVSELIKLWQECFQKEKRRIINDPFYKS